MSSQTKCKGFSLVIALLFIVSGLMSLLWVRGVMADNSSGMTTETTRVGPNLFVDDIRFSPENPEVGEEFTIAVTIRNGGDDSPFIGRINVYVNPDDVPPTRETRHTVRTGVFDVLPAGETHSFSVTNDSYFTEDGQFPVYVWVDYDNIVDEAHEDDNLSDLHCIVVGTGEGNNRCNDAPSPDIYEANDSCADATLLEPNGMMREHNLSPSVENVGEENDVDWFKFEAVSGMTYLFEIEDVGPNANVIAELWANCRTRPFGSRKVFTYSTTTSQTYYIKTFHNDDNYGPNTTWRSRLTILEECVDHSEPNNTCHTAAPIAPGSTEQHTYCKVGDEDWTVLNVEAGVSYEIALRDIGDNASSNMQIHASCNSPFVSLAGELTHSHTADEDGQIFIRTRNDDEDVIGDDTNYTLSVTSDGGADGECASNDAYEPDDSRTTAKSIEVGAEHLQTHRVCPAGDADWVKFDAVAGENYTIETLNLGRTADTVITLYDPSGNEIEHNDDVGGGRASQISWQAPSNGQYTVQMRDFNQDVAGSNTRYDIQIITGVCEPDAFEPDNAQLNAKSLPIDGTILPSRNICGVGDKDFYVLEIPAAETYIIETGELGSNSDVTLTLLDSSGDELSHNDDGIEEGGDRIQHTFSAAGTYYVRVESFDPAHFGSSATYRISANVYDGIESPTPPSPPDIAPPFLSADSDTGIDTLILANYARMVALYGAADADLVMAKAEDLAIDAGVNGIVIDVSSNQMVQREYDQWIPIINDNSENNVNRANDVAAAIRRVVMQSLQAHSGIEHVVVVGSDEIIPFQRIKDRTQYRETEYVDDHLDTDHPTGVALKYSFYLTDDCYVDRKMSSGYGRRRFCLPDLAIGRLVETPAEMINFIDGYLDNDTVVVDKVLVTGYDFVQDGADEICTTWDKHFLPDTVNCTLIGDNWLLGAYSDARIEPVGSPYLVQSINGHANHGREGVPRGNEDASGEQTLRAEAITVSTADYMGGLVYTPGCHAGLNVPASNDYSPLDLPQAYATQGINYIAGTGYGWGSRTGVGLSEQLMAIYTAEITADSTVEMGTALLNAKHTYFSQLMNESAHLDKLDAKVLQHIVYYGLPMYKLQTNGSVQRRSRQNNDPFPSLSFSFDSGVLTNPNQPLSDAYFVSLDLTNQAGLTETVEGSDGRYFSIDGSKATAANRTIQPLFYTNVGEPEADPLRGVIFMGGTYRTEQNFDPIVSSPENEYDVAERENLPPSGWDPAVPVTVRSHEMIQELLIPMGQYNGELAEQRVYNNVDVNLYYSMSGDQIPPTIAHVKAVYDRVTGDVTFSVNTTDVYGVDEVIIAYTEGTGTWESEYLVLREGKWTNTIDGSADTQFFVQAVDEHGNVAYDTNKNHYYTPIIIDAPSDIPLQVGVSQLTTNVHPSITVVILTLITLVLCTNLFWYVQKRG